MNHRISNGAGWLLATLLFAAPSVATAEVTASADLAILSKNEATAFAPLFQLGIPLGPVDVAAEWGLVTGNVYSEFSLKPLNPFISARKKLELGAMDLTIGAGIALPVARSNVGDPLTATSPRGVAALAAAGAARGRWNLWLYQPDAFGIAVPARLDLNVPAVDLALEGAVFVLLDAGSYNDEQEFGGQLAFEAALPVAGFIAIGARLQAVYLPTVTGDNAQLSGEPFASITAGPADIRAGLLVNLDKPLGFGFDDGGVWAFHTGVSFAF